MTAPTTPTMPPVGAPPAPKSKLSGGALIALVIVVVLVLGGIGVLVANAVKSDPTPTEAGGARREPGGDFGWGRTLRAERNLRRHEEEDEDQDGHQREAGRWRRHPAGTDRVDVQSR